MKLAEFSIGGHGEENNFKNAFEQSWQDTESCFDNDQKCENHPDFLPILDMSLDNSDIESTDNEGDHSHEEAF